MSQFHENRVWFLSYAPKMCVIVSTHSNIKLYIIFIQFFASMLILLCFDVFFPSPEKWHFGCKKCIFSQFFDLEVETNIILKGIELPRPSQF